jgi:hypothetical protein
MMREWISNGNRFMFHKGSPARLRAATDDGKLYLTLVEQLIQNGGMKIEQLRFCFCINNQDYFPV